ISTLFQLGYPRKLLHYDKIRSPEIMKRMSEFAINEDEYPGMVIGVNRPLMLNDFEKYCRDNELVIRSARTIAELKTLIIKEGGKAEHKRGYNDDLIFGLVMPLYAFKYSAGKIETVERTKKLLSSIKVGYQEEGIMTGKPKSDMRGVVGRISGIRTETTKQQYQNYGWLFGR